MMARLTKRSVDGFAPRDVEYFVWDDAVSGFGVRIRPTGRRSYVIQYRAGGRTRRMTLGTHGQLTVEQARTLAKDKLGDVAKGSNPSEERRLDRIAPTITGLCERLMKEHAEPKLKATTIREYRHSIDKYIKPAFGTFKIQDVKRSDIAQLHHKMRDKPYQANRTLGVLSKMFNLAEIWGLRSEGTNPCRLVPKYKERRRERFLSDEEMARLSNVLKESYETGIESPYVVAAFRMLILTGCRLREIQELKWDYVLGDYLVLPDSKTGPRRIPLGVDAQNVLKDIYREPGNPYVFCGTVEGQFVTDLQKPWRRIRKAAKIEDVRIHDLRHNFASRAVMGGMNLPLVGRLLGHTQIQTTMRYAHFADGPVQKAADLMGAALTEAMQHKPMRQLPSNVLRFPG